VQALCLSLTRLIEQDAVSSKICTPFGGMVVKLGSGLQRILSFVWNRGGAPHGSTDAAAQQTRQQSLALVESIPKLDTEGPSPPRRRRLHEGSHSMMGGYAPPYDDYQDDYYSDHYDDPRDHDHGRFYGQPSDHDHGRFYGDPRFDRELEIGLLERRKQLSPEELHDQERKQSWAIREIQAAESVEIAFDRMDNLIEEDWLGGLDEIPGNIYRWWAFGGCRCIHLPSEEQSLLGWATTTLQYFSRASGNIAVWLIQVYGSPLVFFTMLFSAGEEPGDKLHWDLWEPSFSDWIENIPWQGLTKLLGLLFVFTFVTNGTFVVFDELKTFQKIEHTYRVLRKGTHDMCMFYLWMDVFTNCWVVIWCSLASFLVLGAAGTAKDILYDALGLLFLYNLDDIGNDIAFLGKDDWPGYRLAFVAWYFDNKIRSGDDDSLGVRDTTCTNFILSACYRCTICILLVALLVLLVLYIVTPFQAMKIELETCCNQTTV